MFILVTTLSSSLANAGTTSAVLEDRTEIEGRRTPESVHVEVGRHIEDLASCTSADPRPTSRAGTLNLAFQVDAAGVPRYLTIEGGSLLSSTIRACVEHRAQALDFGAGPTSGVRVVLDLDG